MKKVVLVRGGFANWFELQNYKLLEDKFDLKIITSHHQLSQINLPTIKLWSPYDLPNFPYKQAILNRLLGGQHWLIGLEQHLLSADIVHVAETYYAYTHQAVQLKKAGKIKTLVSTCWETIPHNNETLPIKRYWKQEAYQYIDHFIVPTIKAKQALILEGVSTDKISLIRVGVDTLRFKPKTNSQHKTRLVVTYIGRDVPEKGVEDLKQAIIPLKDIKINFVHKAPYNEIHHVYQHTDIFVLPSRQTKTWEEQYGMVLVEAMASGLPIITTNTGAIPEIVGSAAILVESHNPLSIRQALETLIHNPSLRHELGMKARRRALHYFDRRVIAKQLANLYNRLI